MTLACVFMKNDLFSTVVRTSPEIARCCKDYEVYAFNPRILTFLIEKHRTAKITRWLDSSPKLPSKLYRSLNDIIPLPVIKVQLRPLNENSSFKLR